MFEVAPEVGERTDSIQMCVIRAIQSRVVVFRVLKNGAPNAKNKWQIRYTKHVTGLSAHKECNLCHRRPLQVFDQELEEGHVRINSSQDKASKEVRRMSC